MLLCLTANHRNTDFDVLDRISRMGDVSGADLAMSHGSIRGAVVVATCNRFETYLDVEDTSPRGEVEEAVMNVLTERFGEDAKLLRESADVITDEEAVTHLFTVSAGLQSMVVGEEEISGQVQRALAAARHVGATSGELEKAFQRAAHTTRAVRARADLASSGRTLARVALDMAEIRVADWSAVRVLIVGTGSYAATTIAALRARGARDVRVFSATGRATLFASKYGVRAEESLRDAIGDADVVITCTARYTVTVDDVPDIAARLVIDLGLPRNVEAAVGTLPGVELIDLELIGKHAVMPELAAGAREIVGSAVNDFRAEREAVDVIVTWRHFVQTLVDTEIQRLRRDGGDPAGEAALRHLGGVIAHEPTVRARAAAGEGKLDDFEAALEAMFGIRRPPSAH